MAADEARAQRIRELKGSRPDLTWRVIAERVGVSERAAVDWAKTGGIAYENARELAGIFDVDVDYVMRGPRGETPDPFATRTELDQRLEAIEQSLHQRAQWGDEVVDEVRQLLRQQSELLARQSELLDEIRALVGGVEGEVTEGVTELGRRVAEQAVARVEDAFRQVVEARQDPEGSTGEGLRRSG